MSSADLTLILALVTRQHRGQPQVVVGRPEAGVDQGHPRGGGEHGAAGGQDGQLRPPEPGDGAGAEVDDSAGQRDCSMDLCSDVDHIRT